jgi:ribulose-5-phosphate 4-epimerase/fuculose-1-phosphate aldolase
VNLNQIIKLSRAAADLVNPLNKTESTIRSILIPPKTKKMIVQAAGLVSAKGFTAGNMGEISVRISGSLEKLAINTRESSFSDLSENDLCLVDIGTGNVNSSKEPANHSEWHRQFYLATDAECVILCQPPYAMVCGIRNQCPDPLLWPDINAVSQKLVCTANEQQAIYSTMKTHRFLLIQGVGLLVTGSNLLEAYKNAEIIEHFCQIAIINHEGKTG